MATTSGIIQSQTNQIQNIQTTVNDFEQTLVRCDESVLTLKAPTIVFDTDNPIVIPGFSSDEIVSATDPATKVKALVHDITTTAILGNISQSCINETITASDTMTITAPHVRINSADVVFNPALVPAIPTQIRAADTTSSVACTTSTITTACATLALNAGNAINMTTNSISYNGAKSSNFRFVYGENDGTDQGQFKYQISMPYPYDSGLFYNCQMWGLTSQLTWFNSEYYGNTDPNITITANGFKFNCPIGTLVKVSYNFALKFLWDGGATSSVKDLVTCLYATGDAAIVPQSTSYFLSDTVNYKYMSAKSSFYMKVLNNTEVYVPLFQQMDSAARCYISNAVGRQKSCISFEIYDFINLNIA